MAAKHFVLIYDRATGHLEIEEYGPDKRVEALQRRFALERSLATSPTTEIVVLAASSVEALKRTHSRYFRSERELAGDTAGAVARSRKNLRRSRESVA